LSTCSLTTHRLVSFSVINRGNKQPETSATASQHASATIMDTNIQRALNDKLYDKRKVGALE
jgi:hypothetical protein